MSAPSQSSLFCQRWRARREYRVPARGVIRPQDYRVATIPQADAKAFVVAHHYSGSFPAARLSVGLFLARHPRLVGVAVFGVPMNQRVIPSRLGVPPAEGVELSRLVLLDEIPANAESWFVARAFRQLRSELPRVKGVISYCDPVPRSSTSGRWVMPGHVGTVYQALNASYLGRARARTLLLSPGGHVVSDRALSKIRLGESGSGYAERQLVALGAPGRGLSEDPCDWLARVLACGVFRRLSHPGNHTYAFALDRSIRHRLAQDANLYPKQVEA